MSQSGIQSEHELGRRGDARQQRQTQFAGTLEQFRTDTRRHHQLCASVLDLLQMMAVQGSAGGQLHGRNLFGDGFHRRQRLRRTQGDFDGTDAGIEQGFRQRHGLRGIVDDHDRNHRIAEETPDSLAHGFSPNKILQPVSVLETWSRNNWKYSRPRPD